MLHSDLEGPVNLGNPHEVTMLDLAHWIRDLAGSTPRSSSLPRPTDDPTVRQPDITLAKASLGWQPSHPSRTG